MADEVIDRLSIQIEGDSRGYNTSIDSAVAKTKAMQIQQKKLVEDLSKNEEQQKKTARSIELSTTKYGANSEKVKSLTDKLNSLKNKEQQLGSQLSSINKVLDNQQKEFTETAQATDKMQKSMSGFMGVVATAATGYAGKKFLEATIGGLAQFEQYETSFEVMLGSMSDAKQMMSDLQAFAKVTPFEVTGITKNADLLMNYGVEAEKLIPTMTQLGDLSKGQAEKLDRISLAYGQMLAKGKVTGEELRQMTEAGVPLMQALADSIGVSTAELSKMIEKGQVGIPQLDKAIEGLTTGNGKFAGLMEKQSKTLIGMWSTTKDEISAVAREIGKDAFVEVKDGLSDVLAEINIMRGNGELKALAKDLGGLLSGLTKGFIGVTKCVVENKEAVGGLVMAYGAFKVIQQVAVMQRLYTTAVQASTVAQKAMNVVAYANPYVALAGALTAVIGGLIAFSGSTNEAKERTKELNEELEDFEVNSISGANEELAKLAVTSNSTIPKIEELGKKSNKTAGEKELLKQYIEDLNSTLDYEAVAIDEVTGKLNMNTDEINKNIKSLEARAKAKAMEQKMIEKQKELLDIEMQIAVIEENRQRTESMRADHEKSRENMTSEEMEFVSNSDADVKSVLPELEEQIKTVNNYIVQLDKSIYEVNNEMVKAIDTSSGFWHAMNNSQSATFVSDLKNMSDSLNVLTSAQKEYADGNKLSVATLEDLAKNYPQLSEKINEYSAGLIGVKDLIGEFPTIYEDEKQSYINSMKSKLVGSEAFYKQSVLTQSSMVGIYKSNYGIDLNNFKSLAEAKNFVETSLIKLLGEKWAEYYNSVGGSATKTAVAMQEQINALQTAKNTMSISMDATASKEIDKQIADLERILNFMKPMQDLEKIEMNVDYTGIEKNFDKILDDISTKSTSKTKDAYKKVEDILKETYDKQLKIAEEHFNQRKKQIDDEHKYKVQKINQEYKDDKIALDNWYNSQKEQINHTLKVIDALINAKRKAREDEKLDNSLSSTQNRIETLQTQITYARSPEEKAELEKELAQQQEELKDLTIKKEVSELETQKKVHEDKLERIEEQYKTELEFIEERKEKELEAVEQAKNATLAGLEQTFTQFQDDLATTYGYVNNETLAIGQRFANATVGALDSGFNSVAKKSRQVIDSMLADVEDAISRLNATMNSVRNRFSESKERGDNYSIDSRDNRSMSVTNNITKGITEGQMSRMMNRQAEQFLYKRR